jgi:hypothetical protein
MRQTSLFPNAPPLQRRYTMLELIACAEREVKKRQQVYPRLIASGQMTSTFAASEIGRMQQIAGELRELATAKGLV